MSVFFAFQLEITSWMFTRRTNLWWLFSFINVSTLSANPVNFLGFLKY
jgi:hypothetical protein